MSKATPKRRQGFRSVRLWIDQSQHLRSASKGEMSFLSFKYKRAYTTKCVCAVKLH